MYQERVTGIEIRYTSLNGIYINIPSMNTGLRFVGFFVARNATKM